jgi:hypothetical protein
MTIKHWKLFDVGWKTCGPFDRECLKNGLEAPPFSQLRGVWNYGALVANFERQQPKAVFPLPVGIKIPRETFRLNCIDQAYWLEENYTGRLTGYWTTRVWSRSFPIEDIRELYRRKIIDEPELKMWISAHPQVTLTAVRSTDSSTSYWDYGSLMEKLPVDDVTELLQRQPNKTLGLVSRLFIRSDTSRENFDRWLEFNKKVCGPRKGNSRHVMYGPVIGNVDLNHLLQWPNVKQLPWCRTSASTNKHLPIEWLLIVFDKWPKVRNNFDIVGLIGRASIVEYILYLRHRVRNNDSDGEYLRRVIARSSRRQLRPAFLELQRHNITFSPTVADLAAVVGITLDDFYFFHPDERPISDITTYLRIPHRLYDIDLITI